MEENPYRAPMFDELPAIDDAAGVSEAEIRAFVGKNADYYLRKWRPALVDHGHARGFNWAAFFLSGLWVPCRKMYWIALVLLGCIAAESVLEEIAVASGFADEQSIAVFDRLVNLIPCIVCGGFGNAWYFAHAKREIARIRALGLETEEYLPALARRGGTSYLASIGLFGLFLATMVVIGVATGLFFSSE